MEWLLGISVVFNVVLALFAGVVMVYKIAADNEAFHAREEWRRWEERFYEAQGKLLQDHNLFVAPTMGEFGKMIIKKHKDT
jgi:hypothetical protein